MNETTTEEQILESENIAMRLSSRMFISSGSFGKLSEALAKAQGQIEGAKKDSNNPFFHARYAALSSVWDACREPLCKNGLAVIQLPGRNGEGLFVDSILSHSSGEWISSRLFVKPGYTDKEGDFQELSDSQAVGSAITYARRYGLQALVGIAPMDDDGEAAMGRQHAREDAAVTARNAPVETRPRKPKPSVPTAPVTGKEIGSVGGKSFDDQIPMFNGPKHEALATRLKDEGIAEDDLMAAAKFAKLIPEGAKAFRLMSESTAAQFVEDPEIVGVILKSWKERPAELI
jgi:hypothetical protein